MEGNNTKANFQRETSWAAAWSVMNEALSKISTTKSVWEIPRFHHEISTSSHNMSLLSLKDILVSRGESWYELFYDLIFVSSAIQMGYILKHNISIENITLVVLLFLILRRTWDHLIEYQNRFDTPDMVHYVFYLIQAMAAFVMTLHLSTNESTGQWEKDRNVVAYSVCAGLSRIFNVIMYLQVLYNNRKYRKYLTIITVGQFLSALIFFAVAIRYDYLSSSCRFMYLWFAGLVIERPLISIVVLFLEHSQFSIHRAPVHFEHLVSRQGMFILLTLGEAIIQLVQSNEGFGVYDYLRVLMGFAVVFNVGDCYYQQQLVGIENPYAVKKKLVGSLWEGLHDILSLLILCFAVGVKLVFHSAVSSSSRNVNEEYFMCIFASISLILIFILRMMHKGLNYRGMFVRRWSYLFRFLVCGLILTIPAFSGSPTRTVFVVFILTTVLVVQDTFSHRGKHRKEHLNRDLDIYADISRDPDFDELDYSPMENAEDIV